MRIRLAAAVLSLPLLAFDCGGEEKTESPSGCTLQIRGAANEDLWCVAAGYDYADLDPSSTMWAVEIAAYRGMTGVGAEVNFFHDGRPALATAYGWNGSTSNVESGSAIRYADDGTAIEGTHEAIAPLGSVGGGTGAISFTFTEIPPPGATGPQLMAVHGTLSGTLPAVDGVSPPVTFSATF